MVKLAVHPVDGVVAGVARGGEVRRDVVHGVRGVVVIVLVTRDAGRAGDVVVAADVAIRARPRGNVMRPGQGPAGGGVVERTIHPVDRVVTTGAGRREVGGDVVHGRLGIVVVVLVTRDASRIGNGVVIVDVAIGAGARGQGMAARQGEARL